jgi:hypothetical protein
MIHEPALAPMFDVSGRRIPAPGLAAAVNPPTSRYALAQPPIDYSVIHSRISEHLPGAAAVSRHELEERSEGLVEALRRSEAGPDLAGSVRVPFVLGPSRHEDYGRALEETFLPAVGRSWKARYPTYDFKNELKGGLAGKVAVAPGSRHDALVRAIAGGPVFGVYFPLALSGFSVDAALAQMADLPDGFVLSGGFDVCAALVACPELIMKTDGYPPQLDLSALEASAPRYAYHFAPYGYNLTFNGRYHNGLASDYCTSGLTWISQKF